jgi:hypothetical protein
MPIPSSMSSPQAAEQGGPVVPSRYRAHRLSDPRPTERGVLYRRGERRFLLDWARVECALAAAIGPAGPEERVLFDLAVQVEGAECVVFRAETESGPVARAFARAVRLGVGAERCHASLGELGPERRYADVGTFEDAALESIRFR